MRIRAIPVLAALAVSMLPLVASSPAMGQGETRSNQFWWPENLDLQPLRDHGVQSDPMGDEFNYAAAFATLDLDEVKNISRL